MAFDMASATPANIGKFDMASAVPVKGNDGGEGVAFGEGLANSVPGGQKITSAIGAVGAKLYGDDRTIPQLYKQANADTEATASANPKSALAGSATGIVSSLPIFGAAGKLIKAGAGASLGEKTVGALSDLGTPAAGAGYASRGANLAVRSAKGAVGAAPVGALYGATNDTTGDTGSAALSGAKTAAALGAGLPVVGAGLGVAADIAGPASRTIAEKVAPAYAAQAEQDIAMGKIIKRINADFPDPVERQAALEKAINTPGVGLAEGLKGKQTTDLATGAAQYPSGKAEASDYIDTRTSGAPSRIAKTFTDQVSANNDYFGTLDGIMAKGRQAAKPLYDAAFQANKSVVSPAIDKILDTPAGKAALGKAREFMMNDQSMMGVPDKELGEQMRDAVQMGKMADPQSQGVASGLNMRSLDYVKKALDEQISTAYRAGNNHEGGILNGLKNNLLKEMDAADVTGQAGPNSLKAEGGAYARARAVSGDYLKNSQAMDAGRDFMKPGTAGQPEQIAANFKKLGPTEQESYKAGMVRAVKEAMDKPSADQPNYYTKVFGSADLQNRLKAVLNPSEFDVLSKNMQAEQDLYKFKYDVLGNSRTAEKQIASQEFESGGKEIYQDLINNGSPTKTAIKAATRWVGSMFDGMSNKTAGQVSKILYETDPAEKLKILQSIQKNAQLDPAEKHTAVKAFFSVDRLFKNLSKTQAGVTNGEEDAQ